MRSVKSKVLEMAKVNPTPKPSAENEDTVIPAKRRPSSGKEDVSIQDVTRLAKKQRSIDEPASEVESEATLVKITSLLDDALALSKE